MRLMLAGAMLVVGCTRAPGEPASQDPPSSAQPAVPSVARAIEAPPPAAAVSTEPWYPSGIEWQPFEEGLALAKKEDKPVCLVLYTTWCGHCRNYSHIFGDPRLVRRAKDFVMIRVDADASEAIAKRYQSDGTYVPRTFFLDATGKVDPAAHSDHPRYKHFFDEFHADSLLEGMDQALAAHPKHGHN